MRAGGRNLDLGCRFWLSRSACLGMQCLYDAARVAGVDYTSKCFISLEHGTPDYGSAHPAASWLL